MAEAADLVQPAEPEVLEEMVGCQPVTEVPVETQACSGTAEQVGTEVPVETVAQPDCLVETAELVERQGPEVRVLERRPLSR
jgi:hypothetical protein